MKTVQQEIDRLYLESKNNPHVVSNEAPYYYDLCSIENKSITLQEFYKLFPYYNKDYNSDYWKEQQKRWENIWKDQS